MIFLCGGHRNLWGACAPPPIATPLAGEKYNANVIE